MEPTKEITLSSGGRAWAWRQLLWADELRRATYVAARAPEAALARIRAKRQRDLDVARGIAEGPDAEIVLTDADLDEAGVYERVVSNQELAISISHWEGVLNPRTGEPLRFPEDLALLSSTDASELIKGCRAAIAEGVPDPNSSGGRSSSASATGTTASTPSGQKNSRRRG